MNRSALSIAPALDTPHLSPSAETHGELRRSALHWLSCCGPAEKAAGVRGLATIWQQGGLTLDTGAQALASCIVPGRPARPLLVPPLSVPRRSMASVDGRAVLLHALAHIEFNAINLALDALWRFDGMPDAYYKDWLQVAAEEALHFSLLAAHLRTQGFEYGDFPSHDSLWQLAERTKHDVLARIALVPRTMEARGLDASPPMRAKLAQAGDHAAAAILDIILRDEIGHVAVGNRWYRWLCIERSLDPVSTYAALVEKYRAPVPRGPFNLAARRAAGFTDAELELLKE
ncbi:MAG: ferritin-like domain-containing protein [Herminiimonas sp.]|nr:ferritin-like domain-containing protein [Herminiimonas sp.]